MFAQDNVQKTAAPERRQHVQLPLATPCFWPRVTLRHQLQTLLRRLPTFQQSAPGVDGGRLPGNDAMSFLPNLRRYP
eukprot:11166744-Lingulodinium_polyedra.AAC.1